MTWHTQMGERVLNSAEAALLRATIGSMRDELLEERSGRDQWPYGVRVFDNLSLSQRLRLLCEVSDALLKPEIPAPELTAINEGTAAAIFKALQQRLHFELDSTKPQSSEETRFAFHWRELIRGAALSTIGDERLYRFAPGEIPVAESDEHKDWEGMVESLADRVLWDTDFDDDDPQADHSPERTEFLRVAGDITMANRTSIAPEPREKEVAGLLERLHFVSMGS